VKLSRCENSKVSNCHIQSVMEKTHPPRTMTFCVAIWVYMDSTPNTEKKDTYMSKCSLILKITMTQNKHSNK